MNKNKNSVRIIPLGGLERIGVNITAIEYNDEIIVIDCGLGFPEDDMFGIDLVIPDVTYLEDHKDKVRAFMITHGHEDHIGALPYILKKINVPVFATTLTQGLIENKLREHELLDVVERHTVHFGDVVKIGPFGVEFIKTNHSIVDSAALAIHTPAGVIARLARTNSLSYQQVSPIAMVPLRTMSGPSTGFTSVAIMPASSPTERKNLKKSALP